jgi:hypothetical protein
MVERFGTAQKNSSIEHEFRGWLKLSRVETNV